MSENNETSVYIGTFYNHDEEAGYWAALIVRNDQIRTIAKRITDTSQNKLILTAALEVLTEMTKGETVTIYSTMDYLVKGFNEWLGGWIRNRWRNSTKQPVSFQDEWLSIIAMTGKVELKINRPFKSDPFSKTLGKALENVKLTRENYRSDFEDIDYNKLVKRG